jgi:hypothetical protein
LESFFKNWRVFSKIGEFFQKLETAQFHLQTIKNIKPEITLGDNTTDGWKYLNRVVNSSPFKIKLVNLRPSKITNAPEKFDQGKFFQHTQIFVCVGKNNGSFYQTNVNSLRIN